MTHPEQLPPPGDLADTPEDLERMFALIEIQLRAAALWYAGWPSRSRVTRGDADPET